MTIQFRRKLLAFFVALFIILGVGTLYYSQGYRIDFSNWTIEKTGAVYIDGYQRPVTIYLNNKQYADQSGFLKSGTLISSILPKKYRLTVTKDGFYTYEKNINVEPSQVVRLFHVLLVPTTIATTTRATDTQGDAIVDVTGDGSFITHTTKPKEYYNAYTLPLPTASSTHILITASSSALTKQKFTSIRFYPQNSKLFIGQSRAGLFTIDIADKKVSPLYSGTVDFYTTQGDTLYVIAPVATTTAATSTKIRPTVQKTTSPAPAGIIIASISNPTQATSTERYPMTFYGADVANFEVRNQYQALLLKNGALSLYDTAQATTTFIANDAVYFSFSPDGKKFLWQDKNGAAYVYMLSDDLEALNARRGDTIPLYIMNGQSVVHLWWYTDSYHVIVAYPDKIMLAEVSTIDPNNAFTIAPGGYQDAAYVQQKNTLLLLNPDKTLQIISLDFSS